MYLKQYLKVYEKIVFKKYLNTFKYKYNMSRCTVNRTLCSKRVIGLSIKVQYLGVTCAISNFDCEDHTS